MGLQQEQIYQFYRQGVLIAPKVLSRDDLQPVIEEMASWIEQKAAHLYILGKLTDTHRELDFTKRIAALQLQVPDFMSDMDIYQVRGRAMHAFLSCTSLLDAVESLIGREITCSPIQHVRAKVPHDRGQGMHASVPWHQDAGVTLPEADESDILTCWIPLVDARREHGCMEVIPGVGRNQLLKHSRGDGGPMIADKDLPDLPRLCAECPKGGVVFMNKTTPHRGLPNLSDMVRWNIDLRYQKTGTPTGRPFYPDFPVRSDTLDLDVARNHQLWSEQWQESLQRAKGLAIHRN